MNDIEFIDRIARTWIDNGGDSEGFSWGWKMLGERISELETENQEGEK